MLKFRFTNTSLKPLLPFIGYPFTHEIKPPPSANLEGQYLMTTVRMQYVEVCGVKNGVTFWAMTYCPTTSQSMYIFDLSLITSSNQPTFFQTAIFTRFPYTKIQSPTWASNPTSVIERSTSLETKRTSRLQKHTRKRKTRDFTKVKHIATRLMTQVGNLYINIVMRVFVTDLIFRGFAYHRKQACSWREGWCSWYQKWLSYLTNTT